MWWGTIKKKGSRTEERKNLKRPKYPLEGFVASRRRDVIPSVEEEWLTLAWGERRPLIHYFERISLECELARRNSSSWKGCSNTFTSQLAVGALVWRTLNPSVKESRAGFPLVSISLEWSYRWKG